MEFIKQCKGKDLSRIPKSKLDYGIYYGSTKIDGNYVQIHKKGDTVKFFTSGGKEFYLKNIAESLIKLNKNKNFVLEGEYVYGCLGKLGDRPKSARLTTYRTNFRKGVDNENTRPDYIYIFDVLSLSNSPFSYRATWLNKMLVLPCCMKVVKFDKHILAKHISNLGSAVDNGWEGLFLKHENHVYKPGKRVNNAIKLKKRPTADLECIGVEGGEGKYTGMIGSLVLQDDEGRIVRVGSGLNDIDRALSNETKYVGQIIEIQYEQILDTYIQPVFVGIKGD